jgi:hypothetical protein
MQALRPIMVDLAAGVVTLGGMRVALQRKGERYVASGGLQARALTFEERSWVVAGALIDPEPNRALLTKLRNLANISGDHGDEVADALALALAGGGELAPGFAECARAACRNGNLDWQTIQQTPAVLVDQLASQEGTLVNDGGWTRFEFREEPEHPTSLAECCEQMLERLLDRGMPQQSHDEHQAAPEAPSWPPQTTPRSADCDGQTDERHSASDKLSSQPESVRTRAAQPLRARATLDHVEPPSPPDASPTPNTLSKPLPIGGSWRAASPRPQGQLSVSTRPEFQQQHVPSIEGGTSPNLANDHAPASADMPQAGRNLSTTLRDMLAPAGTQAIQSAPITWQTPAPDRTAAPIPMRGRIRAHRLRDLPTRSQPAVGAAPEESARPWSSPSGESVTTLSDPTMEELQPNLVAPRRDWIYEIAAALADECDLRGLDA